MMLSAVIVVCAAPARSVTWLMAASFDCMEEPMQPSGCDEPVPMVNASSCFSAMLMPHLSAQ